MKFSRYNLFIPVSENYLLVNTLSGALYKINEDIRTIIQQNDVSKLDTKAIDDYYAKGILVDDNIDEKRIIKYLHNKEKYCTKVLSLTLLLTMECNFSCVYCFEGKKTKLKKYLNKEGMKSIYNFIENLLNEDKNIEIIYITLFGGGPLLNLKNCGSWLEEIKVMCENRDKEFHSGIITNGSLMSSEHLDILKRCNCRTIQITLDGTERVHNARRYYGDGKPSFEDVMHAIKLSKERKDLPNPIIRINIDKDNIHCIEELLKYLANNNLNDCMVDFGIVKAGNSENTEYERKCFNDYEMGMIFKQLWIIMKRMGFIINTQPMRINLSCGLYNDKSFTICPDLKVYKCWEYVEDSRFYVGTLCDDGRIGNVSFHFFDWMTKEFEESKRCAECVYLPVCGGGCAAISFEKNKTIHDHGCHKVRGIFEEKVKLSYFNKQFKENNNENFFNDKKISM